MILGVSRNRQWKERLTSEDLARWFGMDKNMADTISGYRCRWLGHLARMEDFRIPKQLLFGELTKTRPRHGPKKRWRDLAVTDVRTLGIERDWFEIAQDRLRWSTLCEQFRSSAGVGEICAVAEPAPTPILRCTCGRTFWRPGDLTRHRRFCGGQHLDRGSLEPSTFHCFCGRVFHRKEDLTRHSRFCEAT